jgi:hypothetical protein
MGPDITESLINAGERGILLHAVTSGNYPLLKRVLGPIGARQLATEMTTNPRFINLTSKMISAFERGAPAIASKVYNQIVHEIAKSNPDAAREISGLDMQKIFDALESNESNN